MYALNNPERVFPARAGMIPICSCQFPPARCIPRESGDDPTTDQEDWGGVVYSPRERG